MSAKNTYRSERMAHWNLVAVKKSVPVRSVQYYHEKLLHYFSIMVPPGMRILEVGCGNARLLSALKPSTGVGIDFSASMLAEAMRHHPHLAFVLADACRSTD